MNAAPPLKIKPKVRRSSASAEAAAEDLERRPELGQFFTSPDVAGFIWNFLEVIHGKRFSANTRLIDPACGEGVFLRVAHERVGLPAKNLFGADIDTGLAPGWREDALLREANLVVANGLLDDPANRSARLDLNPQAAVGTEDPAIHTALSGIRPFRAWVVAGCRNQGVALGWC